MPAAAAVMPRADSGATRAAAGALTIRVAAMAAASLAGASLAARVQVGRTVRVRITPRAVTSAWADTLLLPRAVIMSPQRDSAVAPAAQTSPVLLTADRALADPASVALDL